VQISPK